MKKRKKAGTVSEEFIRRIPGFKTRGSAGEFVFAFIRSISESPMNEHWTGNIYNQFGKGKCLPNCNVAYHGGALYVFEI